MSKKPRLTLQTKLRLTLVWCSVGLTGCGLPGPVVPTRAAPQSSAHYSREGATESDVVADLRACQGSAEQALASNLGPALEPRPGERQQVMDTTYDCMEKRGYTVSFPVRLVTASEYYQMTGNRLSN